MRYTLLLLLLFGLVFNLKAQTLPESQLILASLFYNIDKPETLEEAKKQYRPVFLVPKDTIFLAGDQILLQADETFYYRLALRIIHKEGNLGFLTLPINNSVKSEIYEEVKNSLKINSEGAWEFQFTARAGVQNLHKSMLAFPPKGSQEVYVYRFCSYDRGRNWEITQL